MVELNAKMPFDGTPSLLIADLELKALDLGPITSIAPYRGEEDALCAALMQAHGIGVPPVNRVLEYNSTQALWFGYDQMILTGVQADASLARYAALSDQSDAWAVLQLEGRGAADVLARLTPLDLRPCVFQKGHSARSDLMHMPASISCLAENRFMVMVFRSMAQTLWHDMQRAMEGVAARG